MTGRIRQQSQKPRSLYSPGQTPLVFSAGIGSPPRFDLATNRNIATQLRRVFVVYSSRPFGTKRARPRLADEDSSVCFSTHLFQPLSSSQRANLRAPTLPPQAKQPKPSYQGKLLDSPLLQCGTASAHLALPSSAYAAFLRHRPASLCL